MESTELRAARSRKRWTTLLLVVCLVVVTAASGLVLNHYYKPKRDESSSLTVQGATARSQTLKACSAVTTCQSNAFTMIAYSALYVFVSAVSTTAPSGISDTSSDAFGSVLAHAAGAAEEEYVYRVDNVTATASNKVTVTFASSTTYTIGAINVANVTTVSFDAAGSGTSGGAGSTTISDSVTTTHANDLVLLGVSLAAARAVFAVAPAVLLQSNGATGGSQSKEAVAATGAVTLAENWTSTVSSTVAIAIAIRSSVPPSAPTSLAAGTVTQTTVPLTWTNFEGPNANNTVYQATYASGACGAYSTHYSAGAVAAFTATGLTSGTAYCFEVTQWNSTGESADSTAITNIQTANKPAAPTGLTVTPTGGSTTSLTVTWSDPAKDTGLLNSTVYVTTGGSCTGAPVTTSAGVVPTVIVPGLTANTLYGVTVQLWNVTGASPQTSCVTATTYAVPAAPTGLGVTATTTTTVALAWTNPGGSLVNNTVYVGLSCGTWTSKLSTGGVASTYTVTGLSPFTTYCFEVSAWSAGSEGSLSASQTDKTLTVVPGPPTSPSAAPASSTSLTLTWTNPSLSSGTLLNNTVYSGTSCSSLSTVTSTVAAVQTFTLTGLAAGTTYCLRVSAWDQAGESARSVFFNGTTFNAVPSAPTALAYVSASRTAITISWTQPAGTLVNDTVYWKAGATCASGAAGISASVTSSYTVNGLTPAAEYCFLVTGWTNGGQSAQSSAVTGFTQGATPAAPINLRVFSIGSTWANVVWTNPAGYTLFNNSIYWKQTTCGPAWTTMLSAGAVVASYNITGLTAGQSYCVTVTAWDDESPHSNAVVLTTPSPSSGSPSPLPCCAPPATGAGDHDSLVLTAFLAASTGLVFLLVVLVLRRSHGRSGGRRRGR